MKLVWSAIAIDGTLTFLGMLQCIALISCIYFKTLCRMKDRVLDSDQTCTAFP